MISFLVDIAVQIALLPWVSATVRQSTQRQHHNDLRGRWM